VASDGGKVLTPRHQRHVMADLGQKRSDVAAQAAGADDDDSGLHSAS
jgi:hypothetical protein